MNDNETYTGGCLCGTLRYEASGEPAYAAYCYCGDCRKASGSGFIPFMRFPASALRIKGETRKIATRSAPGAAAACAVPVPFAAVSFLAESAARTTGTRSIPGPSTIRRACIPPPRSSRALGGHHAKLEGL